MTPGSAENGQSQRGYIYAPDWKVAYPSCQSDCPAVVRGPSTSALDPKSFSVSTELARFSGITFFETRVSGWISFSGVC